MPQLPLDQFHRIQLPPVSIYSKLKLTFRLINRIYLEPAPIPPPIPLPVPIPENKLCPKPRGQFPAPACNKFINCWDGTAIEQECPGGLVFNPQGFCDYQYNVDCGGKPIVTSKPNILIVKYSKYLNTIIYVICWGGPSKTKQRHFQPLSDFVVRHVLVFD